MKSRILLNLVLFAVVAGLSLFIYLKPKPASHSEFPLSSQASNTIRQIKIEKKGQPAIELQKRGDAWFLATPFQGRGNIFKVDQLLDLLKATSKQRFEATHLERFELDKPLLTLTFNQQIFYFGTINPLSQEQYVSTGNAVYLLPTSYFSTALAQPSDFASKKILAEDEIPAGFIFDTLHLTRSNGNWVASPDKPGLSQDRLNAFADHWREASALLSQPYDQSKPLEEFSLRLTTGKIIPIKILQRQPELILLRADENLQYHFPQETAASLLNPQ